jgi:hypothetical protein
VRTLFVWIINLLIYAVASAFVPDASDQLQPVALSHHASSTAAAAAAGVVPAAGSTAGSSVSHFPSGGGTSSSSSSSISLLGQQQQQQLGLHGLWQSLFQQQWQQPNGLSSSNSGGFQPGSAAAAAAGFVGLGPSVVPAPAELVDVNSQLPGEPWLAWSFLQAAGFLVLVLGECQGLGQTWSTESSCAPEGCCVGEQQAPGVVLLQALMVASDAWSNLANESQLCPRELSCRGEKQAPGVVLAASF